VAESREFQQQVQKIGELVHDLESIADPASREAAKRLVQLLMDLHGKGLERSLEIIFGSGKFGSELIDELGQDSLVGSLLVLYGLHPEDLQTRAERKLEEISAKLHKMGAEAKLIAIEDGNIRVQLHIDGHACGSTKQSARAVVEEALYEAAPDLTSLSVESLDPPVDGFVAVSQLAGPGASVPASLGRDFSLGSEGMD
jgi:Fe-S cluster biogenesis protein NfuA